MGLLGLDPVRCWARLKNETLQLLFGFVGMDLVVVDVDGDSGGGSGGGWFGFWIWNLDFVWVF